MDKEYAKINKSKRISLFRIAGESTVIFKVAV